MAKQLNLGIVGCGNISSVYFRNCQQYAVLNVVACADLELARAQTRAAEFGVPRACSVDELLADPAVDMVVNLTVPAAHAEVSLAAIAAGKHVYSEKPLAIDRHDGRRILEEAAGRGLRVGCAPDTFLGGGLQTGRKLLDDGWIGEPVAAVAFLAHPGPESWHPNPEFFYQKGAGPLFDMGPYYLTTLVALLGPIRRVTASARASFAERPITSQPLRGQKITVRTPTHVAGVLDFQAGAVASLMTSFDVWATNLPRIEIYGSAGSMSVPDPNRFDGVVRVRRAGASEWSEIPLTHGSDMERSIGVADMAYGLLAGRPHRASGALAFHVLDAMQALEEASAADRHIALESRCERPAALPLGLRPFELDE